MPRVTSLDGRVYDLDEETLEKCRIPDEQVRQLGMMPPLSSPVPVKDTAPDKKESGTEEKQARHGAADGR